MPASQVLWRARTVPEAMESSNCRPCRGWATEQGRGDAAGGAGPWQAGRGRCARWPAPQGRRVRMNCGPGRPAEIRLAAEESRDHIPSAHKGHVMTAWGAGQGSGLSKPRLPPQSHSAFHLTRLEHGTWRRVDDSPFSLFQPPLPIHRVIQVCPLF